MSAKEMTAWSIDALKKLQPMPVGGLEESRLDRVSQRRRHQASLRAVRQEGCVHGGACWHKLLQDAEG